MNNRERVLTALRHQQSDEVPYGIRFMKVARAKMTV